MRELFRVNGLRSLGKRVIGWIGWLLEGEELGKVSAGKKRERFVFIRWLFESESLGEGGAPLKRREGFFGWLLKKESL